MLMMLVLLSTKIFFIWQILSVNVMAMKKTKCTNLPDVLMLEKVLSRLSVKNLLRFQCVSKEFLRLISSPLLKQIRDLDLLPRTPNQHKLALIWYISDDLQENPDRSVILCLIDVLDGKRQSQFELTRFCGDPRLLKSGCSHGLVYFYDWVLAEEIYVCNPSTGVTVKLPESPAASLRGCGCLRIGMGYLPETNTYNIVVWFLHVRNGDIGEFPTTGFEIFTFTDGGKPGSSRWRSLEKEKHPVFKGNPLRFGNPMRFGLCKSICVNGVIYWMDETWSIGSAFVAFDLRTEECRTIPYHPTWEYNPRSYENDLAELQGSLCVVQRACQKTMIWVLRDQDGGWIQGYNIPVYFGRFLTCLPTRASRDHDQDHAGQQEEDLDLVFMENGRYTNLCYYNTRNKCVRRSSEPSWVNNLLSGHSSCVYFDTLFNPGIST